MQKREGHSRQRKGQRSVTVNRYKFFDGSFDLLSGDI